MNKTFHISGMHCRSCKTLIEEEVKDLAGIKDIQVDHQSGEARLEYDKAKTNFKKISKTIKNLGYSPSESKNTRVHGRVHFMTGALVLILSGYFLVQYFGGFEMLSRLNDSGVSYGLLFLIGVLASFHCVGMCGGLIVAYSAKVSSGSDMTTLWTSHIQYNLGRFFSYTAVGAVLGGIGSFFAINPSFSGAVMLVAGAFMLLMALSLYSNFRWIDKILPKTPQFVTRLVYRMSKNKSSKTPLLIGLLTGFMPCGPLQAIQLYALSTGSLTRGALSMAVYALGTAPLLLGFGSLITKLSGRYVARAMKVSGIVVAVLALIMINRGLINFGWGFSGIFASGLASETSIISKTDEFQTINMDLTYSGYSPSVLYIKPGIPVRWVINVKQMTGCTDAIMIESLNVYKDLEIGENIIEFTPPTGVQEIKFSCWMRMVWGKFVVSDKTGKQAPAATVNTTNLPPSSCGGSGSCGGTCGQSSCGCSGQ